MTEIANKNRFGRWATSVFFENTAILMHQFCFLFKDVKTIQTGPL